MEGLATVSQLSYQAGLVPKYISAGLNSNIRLKYLIIFHYVNDVFKHIITKP